MKPKTDKYADFVEHPRFGRGPNITGLNPSPFDPQVNLHWNAGLLAGTKRPNDPGRIANTAIAADLTRQTPATVAVTHYFDLERKCRDCGRPFIFFAREQKYWYEVLGFGLESDCVRCIECRKQQQGLARQREVYESLFHIPDKTVEQLIEMADACLALVESGVFRTRQTERVRMLLNAVPENADVRRRSRYKDLQNRVLAAEGKSEEQT